ncbi:MAG: hypothetical protein AABY15_01510 [Nanoarchaeota archaeon]
MDTVIKRPEGEDCPSDDFEKGTPAGKCWGDGHYMCDGCKHFRSDFVGAEGVEKRDNILRGQSMVNIYTIEEVLSINYKL